jgi:hypothetical protein
MTDYAELKRLAEATEPVAWYHPESHGLRSITGAEERAFISAANPAAILALLNELQNLRTVQRASFNASGQIKAAASELGFNPAQEEGALEYLIGLAREVTGLREKCARLEEDNEAMWENPGDLL